MKIRLTIAEHDDEDDLDDADDAREREELVHDLLAVLERLLGVVGPVRDLEEQRVLLDLVDHLLRRCAGP